MRLILTFITTCLLSGAAIAQSDIQIKGKITQAIPDNKPRVTAHQWTRPAPPKTVTLLDVQLSERAWNKLSQNAQNIKKPIPHAPSLTTPYALSKAPATNVQLGMNNVPVMNQGNHGTCATFAVTAAIDAALDVGDYISQVCTLQLGQHLERLGYNPSGWDGSLNPLVLDQIRAFGFVNKASQRQLGCGGFTEYPAAGETPDTDLSLADHYDMSEPLLENSIAWTPLLDVYQVFLDQADPDKTLESVKQSLRKGDRLTFGVLLFRLNEGTAGALGQHHAINDTWVLTPEVIDDINEQRNYGGHAILITGFDNDAIAIDRQGRKHRGLLTIRNSWGEDAGDEGNFYMSYDYFKVLTIEIQRIRSLKRFTE